MSNYREVLDAIRNKASIIDIIGERIPLKRQGRNFTALCPFHEDTNPSLSISEPKQIFKCFACGVGGDIFKFVMEFDKLDFKTTVKFLANKYKVPLSDKFSFNEKNYIDPHLEVKGFNSWVAEVYHNYLFQSKQATGAREYILKRKIPLSLLKAFKVGFAPRSSRGSNSFGSSFLFSLYEKANFKLKNLGQVGLFSQNQYGEIRDFFFNRVIFPIYNEKKEVLGFGGRVLSSEEQPKYLNSKESPWFKKREILYGISESYQKMIQKKEVYVVEGYLDVMACYLAELPAVAPLGTALTIDQIRKLKRYVSKIHLFFDGDSAGKKAALRSASDLAIAEADGKVYLLNEGDPFDFIQKNSTKVVKEFISTQGVNLYDFIVAEQFAQVVSPVDKMEQLRSLFILSRQMKQAILRSDFIKKVENTFNISWKSVEENFGNMRVRIIPKNSFSHGLNRSKKQVAQEDINIVKLEKSLVLFLCEHPEYIKKAFVTISLDSFIDGWSKYIGNKLINNRTIPNLDLHKVLALFSNEEEQSIVEKIQMHCLKKEQIMTEDTLSKEARVEKLDNELEAKVVKLKLEVLKKKNIKLRKLIRECEEQNQIDRLKVLQEEKLALNADEENLKDSYRKLI